MSQPPPAPSPTAPAPSSAPHRPRRRQKRGRGWGPAEDEGWPPPRRSRWEPAGPEGAAGPGPPPPPPLLPWARGRRGRGRPAGEPWGRPGGQRPPRGGPAWEQWGPGGGGGWGSPQREGGGPPGGQGAWEPPRGPRRQQQQQGPEGGDGRGWGSPSREGGWGSPSREGGWDPSRNLGRPPAWEGSPGGDGERWGAEGGGRRGEGSQSPGREQGWGSPGRDLREDHRWCPPSREQAEGGSDGAGGRWGRAERRGREQHSPAARRQGGWGSPKRQERSRHDAREQGQGGPDKAGSRWSSAWCREGSDQSLHRDEGRSDSLKREWQSPNREARGKWGSPRRYRADGDVGETGAENDSHEREDEEKDPYAGGRDSPGTSAHLVSSSCTAPEGWTPCDSVVQWWMNCPNNLRPNVRKQLMTICPRPTLPDRSSETPQINPDLLYLLKKKEERNIQRATQVTQKVQNEVLDMLAPAMTICQMAEEAIEKAKRVDPLELREWGRHLIRFIATINHMLILQCRSQVLATINPRLRSVASKMKGRGTDGLLFAEDKVKLLKVIIKQFPELSGPTRRMPGKGFHAFARAPYYKQPQRRPYFKARYHPPATGPGSYKRGAANPRGEDSRSPGTKGQDPARWR